jgi:hypothetical protein
VITTISQKLGIPYFYRIDAIIVQMRIHKGGREGPADGLNGGEDAVARIGGGLWRWSAQAPRHDGTRVDLRGRGPVEWVWLSNGRRTRQSATF